jgi:hypothetical protein
MGSVVIITAAVIFGAANLFEASAFNEETAKVEAANRKNRSAIVIIDKEIPVIDNAAAQLEREMGFLKRLSAKLINICFDSVGSVESTGRFRYFLRGYYYDKGGMVHINRVREAVMRFLSFVAQHPSDACRALGRSIDVL